jgi:hypothetical protein
VLALPNEVGGVELVLLFAGALVGVAAAWAARGRLLDLLPAAPARPSVALVVAAALAAAVGAAPLTVWRVAHDIRYTSGISRPVAERIGAYENYLDGSVFDEIAAAIPPQDTYYVTAANSIEPDRARGAFRVWALTALLPRRAVARPGQARWLVTWGIDPRKLGVAVADVRRVREPGHGLPATWLARVA